MVPGGQWHSAGAAAQFGRVLATLWVGLLFTFVAARMKAAMEKRRGSILKLGREGGGMNGWVRNGWKE